MRVNITITEPDGTTTKLNSPGAAVATADLDRLADALVRARRQAVAGSCSPARCRPARPPSWYAELVAALRGTGARVAVDTQRRPARGPGRPARAGSAPHLMKPNGEELASFTGGDADGLEADPAAAAAAPRTVLVDRGVEAVLATLGAHGAVLVTARGRLARHPAAHHRRQHRRCRRLQPVRLPARATCAASTPTERLALAVAYGSAAAGLPGTTIPHPRPASVPSSSRSALASHRHPQRAE